MAPDNPALKTNVYLIEIRMSDKPKRTITTLVKDYGKRLLGFVRGRVSSDEDAEDILQEVWYQLSKLTDLDELESAGSWLFQVARNKITDQYRRKKTDSLEDYSYEDEVGELQLKEILLMDTSNDPELAMFKEIFWKELLNALDELPPEQKEVFIQHELEDRTLQEIADNTGENLKTIISRKGYAVKSLRRKLAHLYDELNY